ncbi:hypothetical protein [Longimicrobium sp.]|uniref:hypothetical protein n=1 Tax=Longimicrobium sp. TaxID=2029185 RepID=UPI003B3A1982
MTSEEILARPIVRPRGIRAFFKNLLYWILDWDDEITLAEGRQRMRNSPGFYGSLTPEQREFLRTHEGPDFLSPPLTRRNRRFLLQESPPAP